MDIHQHHQCALCPRLTHGGLDLQRNDRLGRRRSHHRFEHRREILRAIQRDADANSNCNDNSYAYGDSDSDTDGYLNAQFNGDIHSNCDADSDVKSESYTGSTSSTHSGTATVRMVTSD